MNAVVLKSGKKKLEILLQKLEPFNAPDVLLEQYVTPANVAAEILYTAYLKGDIKDKTVIDLGCGTGIFAIGCALLGAREVTGIDKDGGSLEIAKKNSDILDVDIKWVKADVKDINTKVDTVFQNPPFGVHNKKADRGFLKTAVRIGKIIYTMHKHETRKFIEEYISDIGGNMTDLVDVEFLLPRTQKFHKKDKKRIKVDIYRIETT